MSATYEKPLPRIDDRSAPWWEATKRHELLVQKCETCGNVAFPPAPICPRCRKSSIGWVRASGRGSVWSWTVFHKSYFAGYAADIPYVVSIVELEEGPRLWTHVVGVAAEDLKIGMAVEAFFDDVTDEVTLVKFRPAL